VVELVVVKRGPEGEAATSISRSAFEVPWLAGSLGLGALTGLDPTRDFFDRVGWGPRSNGAGVYGRRSLRQDGSDHPEARKIGRVMRDRASEGAR
jgi:hypothetical protein